jgi:ferredoxin--NADP+ reductase
VYRVVEAEPLADRVHALVVEAPHVARNAKAGQFLIVRVDPEGERIPLTISAVDGDRVRVIFMTVGATTHRLAELGAGDAIQDVAGPLGRPSEVPENRTCVIVGGGVGIASCPIIARTLREAGNRVIGIIGARNADLLILEDEMRAACDDLYVTTDDGSRGRHGFAADVLKELVEQEEIGCVWIIGPAIMMKVTSGVTRPKGIRTLVSLNPIMVDGTGMCGSCRVVVNGETRFACVDGPEFDAHAVDFDRLMQRQRIYLEEEREALEHHHASRCGCETGAPHG